MGGAVSASSTAHDTQYRSSPRRRPVMLDATSVRMALQDAGERNERIEELSGAVLDYLQKRKGGEGVDDAILLSLGIINDGVRARLLQYLTELGPLQCPEADGYHRVSRDQGGKGEEKGSNDDYERDFCEEDGQDHYLDDFEYTVESAGSSSPLSVSWVGDGVEALTPRLFTQHTEERPVDAEARMHRKSSSGTPPVDSPICSGGTDEGSSSSHTTRPTDLASPPAHLDSHASTPLTSPHQPSTTHDDHTAGVPLRRKEKVAASDPRQVAEQLNLRLREDKHRERSSSDKSPRIVPGHWKLGQKIGNGSFGQVYVGLNEDTGQFMAVKALPIGGRTGDAETLYHEIQLMRKLEHPNIVRYLGAQVGVKAGKVFIFTEWMAGGSVSSMLDKFGPLKPPAIRTYTSQLLHGLAYLHDHHIIHRDIKGGNLLVDDKGNLKLADFGASKQLGLNGSIDALNGTLKGTPYFMAPEVLMESHYGRRSDIWSVGGAVLEMLTGEAPWKGLHFVSAVALMYHITHSEGPPPLPEHMPPLLRSFLLRCFERDPATRPSARELLSDPFLTQADDVEEEEGRDSGLDWLARTSSGDGSLVQGDLSDWGIKLAGGSGSGSGGKSSSGSTSTRATEDETFELLARALGEREKGKARQPSGSLGTPVTAEPPLRTPLKDDRLVGHNLSRLPVAIGPERVSTMQAGRDGGSLWPMRATDARPSSLRVLTSPPLQADQLSFEPSATSDKLPTPTHPRRRNKTRSDDLAIQDHDLSPTSPTGVRDTDSFTRPSLTHPRSPSAMHARSSSFPHPLTGTLTGLPGLVPPSSKKAPSPRASLTRPALTLSRDVLRAALLNEDPDGTPPSTTRSCVEFSRGGRSSVTGREGDDGAKQGEIETFSPTAARRDRVLASASADAAPQRKTGGQDRLVLPPLDSGMENSRSRLLSPSASLKATRHTDPLTDGAKFQVHRVVHATDVSASWDSATPRDVRTPVVSAPAGCLDSHSTSVYIESTGAVPDKAKQPASLSYSLSADEAKDVEWKCAKQSCGRLNTGDDDHCGFCATIRGSSGGRGERTIVYTRSSAGPSADQTVYK